MLKVTSDPRGLQLLSDDRPWRSDVSEAAHGVIISVYPCAAFVSLRIGV